MAARVVSRAVVVGASPGGLDLAVALARAGVAVVMVEPDAVTAERIATFLRRMPGGDRITLALSLDAVQRAEAVFEAGDCTLAERARTLTALNRLMPDNALLATIPPAPQPNRKVPGFDLAAPAHLRRLAEITPAPETRPADMDAAFDLARQIGKMPVLARFGRASISTRLTMRLHGVAEALLLEGAIPSELDDALVARGFDIGPLEAQDLVGLDVAFAARKANGDTSHLISDRMVHEGRLGKSVGVGWYRYPGGGGAVIDPLIEDLIHEEARFAGVVPRHVSAQEIVDRVRAALVDESRAITADGDATADIIDRVARLGLGIPPGWVR